MSLWVRVAIVLALALGAVCIVAGLNPAPVVSIPDVERKVAHESVISTEPKIEQEPATSPASERDTE
jgi:hypothetical protein